MLLLERDSMKETGCNENIFDEKDITDINIMIK
jgi:hypothetical protein